MMHSPRLHMLRIVLPPPSLGAHPLARGAPARGTLSWPVAGDAPEVHGQEFIA